MYVIEVRRVDEVDLVAGVDQVTCRHIDRILGASVGFDHRASVRGRDAHHLERRSHVGRCWWFRRLR